MALHTCAARPSLGGWMESELMQISVTVEVFDGTRTRVVHVSRIRHHIQLAEEMKYFRLTNHRVTGYHPKLNNCKLKVLPHDRTRT